MSVLFRINSNGSDIFNNSLIFFEITIKLTQYIKILINII